MTAIHLDYPERKNIGEPPFLCHISRIRPYEGEIEPIVDLSDRNLVQLICAYRIFNHELELSLSTRKVHFLREKLLPLGITASGQVPKQTREDILFLIIPRAIFYF